MGKHNLRRHGLSHIELVMAEGSMQHGQTKDKLVESCTIVKCQYMELNDGQQRRRRLSTCGRDVHATTDA